jgi:hypothetical protein
MQGLNFGRYALSSCVAAALLSDCGASQPLIRAPGAIMQIQRVVAPVKHRIYGGLAPDSARGGIYVSEHPASGPDVLGYPNSNRSNGPSICSENAKSAYDVAVDGTGNLIVPDSDYTITVFKGPNMCGPKLGAFHTISNTDYPVDATSADAANGTIAVGIYQDAGSGVGSIELCTLKSNCTTNLVNGSHMNEVYAVAMNKKGDCWASSAQPTALTYFKRCSGSGQTATGYENQFTGGLDIDKLGNLVSLSEASAQAYVYSGCNPVCKLVGGPFPLKGAAIYGHLNQDSSRFATADYQLGQVDIYKYTPTAITFMYSFNNGVSLGANLVGVAYNPRSKE